MELHFTDHARLRMVQRGIDPAEVAEMLAEPDEQHPSVDDPTRTVSIGTTPAGRELFIVTVDANPTLVVTVAERRPSPRR